jgi:hypothetical protein
VRLVSGIAAGFIFRSKAGLSGIVPNFVEIILARENVFDIFRAPFDRNKCAGILAE